MTPEIAWQHSIYDIPERGLARELNAAPDELERVARALELIACRSLAVAYTIEPASQGRFRLSGKLEAEIVQSCVVTLEPVSSIVTETYEAMFWPPDAMPPPKSGELDLDDMPDPEPIENDQIAVGRVVFECLAAAIDPFPRAPGAALDWQPPADQEQAGEGRESPFAVLAKIKTKTQT